MLLGGQNNSVLQHVGVAAEALKELRILMPGTLHEGLAPALQLAELDLREIHRDGTVGSLLGVMKKTAEAIGPIVCGFCTDCNKHITTILEVTLTIMREMKRA